MAAVNENLQRSIKQNGEMCNVLRFINKTPSGCFWICQSQSENPHDLKILDGHHPSDSVRHI